MMGDDEVVCPEARDVAMSGDLLSCPINVPSRLALVSQSRWQSAPLSGPGRQGPVPFLDGG